jgi:magnesium-transporting ATPase (P-type)
LNHGSKTLIAYVKGAPEMIHSLSEIESIPEDFHDVLEKYTQDGLRVLALAYKEYDNFGKKFSLDFHSKYSKFPLKFN